MEENEILNLVISRMTEEGMWFTTKNDPTFTEAPSYYELDEFGDPTEKTISKIVKEVNDKIGDGALEIEDAIEIWLGEQQANYKIAYVDNLVTEFEPKPVIDQIEAYEKPAEMPLTEGVKIPGILAEIPDELFEPSEPKSWTKADWKKYFKDFRYSRLQGYKEAVKEDRLEDFLSTLKYEASKIYGLDDLNFDKNHIKNSIEKIAIAYADKKEKQYKEINNLNESLIIKNRLKEENTKSLNEIGNKLSDPDFDADSEDGQITLRTSQLFNELSDAGLEVQVSFDNGESQSTIAVPEGGQINITIRSSNEPLKAFISGQVQLDNDLVKTITTILDTIDDI